MSPPLPDFVIAGPQKCATTWLYECLREHPDVLLPDTDSVHYFDMHYSRGDEWYRDHFKTYDGEAMVGEETPSYIRDDVAPKRISRTIPNAKVLFVLRNPVDRAFSHYWHEKSKDKMSFEFSEVFENYDLFSDWVVPGLYNRHIERYLKHIPSENLKLCFFHDLVDDDWSYLQDVCEFLDIDPTYKPSVLDSKVNEGKVRGLKSNPLYRFAVHSYSKCAPQFAIEAVRPAHDAVQNLLTSQNEYERGMRSEDRKRLEALIVDDIRELDTMVDRSLSHWFEYETL
ncbi:sulfotransferase domain-containing protein [Haloplanus natans]|uniref:sulfotransferase domain-containing protein n=1 Tax=Haloplanus natans TaxID=376171 RepID=UPI0006779C81|nr:sulfotransferase domain-containing protein [Haloplanus natans]